jgi:hypothetical protein
MRVLPEFVSLFFLLPAQRASSQPCGAPRTWDTVALSDWATPVASINVPPDHFSEKQYYRAPLDNYRTYPVYRPDREPGYWDSLKRKSPNRSLIFKTDPNLALKTRKGTGFYKVPTLRGLWYRGLHGHDGSVRRLPGSPLKVSDPLHS